MDPPTPIISYLLISLALVSSLKISQRERERDVEWIRSGPRDDEVEGGGETKIKKRERPSFFYTRVS